MRSQYKQPKTLEELRESCSKEEFESIQRDPARRWCAVTGISLIFPCESKDDLDAQWRNWRLMDSEVKRISDQKSIELFGEDNETRYLKLLDECDYFKQRDISQEDVDFWRRAQKMIY